jgi:hypothetical protein
MEICAHRKRPGEWFLTLRPHGDWLAARVVLDQFGGIVFLPSALECTRYAQERFGDQGISDWGDVSRFL